jgi:small subunit ribosomal protein S4
LARYNESICRLCRREGVKLFLKGERCYTPKCALSRRTLRDRPLAPGQHGQVIKKLSDYGVQLREKQKVRRIYGTNETQFRNYFMKANKQKGITGENLLKLLELRLDNVVYRLGFATSRRYARQLVRHGHIFVNGRCVDIPSYQTSIGEEISVSSKSELRERISSYLSSSLRQLPSWLELDQQELKGRILSYPSREEIDMDVQEQLVVEFYSR